MKTIHAIPDGYERTAYIDARPQLYPALRIKYRPMLAEHRDQIREAITGRSNKQGHSAMVAAMQSRLVEWNATSGDGNPLAISAANIRHLQPALFDRVYLIIAGIDGGDSDPDDEDSEQDEQDRLALEAAIAGRPIGDVQREADEKN